MNILLINDDGIHAEGLAGFGACLKKLGDVTIVAPSQEASAAGHSITLHRPLTHKPVYKNGEFFGHSISGTPADCVKLAVSRLLESPPDIVVSGLNVGANVGINILYSGTVAAAVEGAMLGIPSVAFSICYSKEPRIKEGCRLAASLLRHILEVYKGDFKLLNINLPDCDKDRIKGVKVTRQSCIGYTENFDKRVDPRGRTYYWMTGDLEGAESESGSDIAALEEGYITITPLQYDLTNYLSLEKIQNWNFD